MTTEPELQDGLTRLMRADLGPAATVEVSDIQRLAAGLSRENWVFEGRWSTAEEQVAHPLILRRDPVGSLIDTDRRTEFELLRVLEPTGLPTPRARWLDESGELVGRPGMVMIREPGVCDWFALNSDRPLAMRRSIAAQLLRLLGDIHQLDWAAAGVASVLDPPTGPPSLHELGRWERVLEDVRDGPQPELAYAAAWLRGRAPRAQAVVLVHGDYKPGNALLVDDRVTAVLDWELAHLGDPLEDLGWVTNPYRAREHQIDGAWTRCEIVTAYEAATSFAVPETDLLWWNVFSCFKLATIIVTGISSFLEGTFDVIYQHPTRLFRTMFDLIDRCEREVAA